MSCPGCSSSSGGAKLLGRKRPTTKVFGAKGKEGISYLGDTPFQFIGEYRVYVWKPNKRSQWVDKRDIPRLIKEVGLENLAGRNLDAYKEQKEEKAKKAKPKAKAKKPEPQPEQVEQVEEAIEPDPEPEAPDSQQNVE